MAPRSFFAIDSDSLIVTSSTNPAIVGDPITINEDTPDGTIFRFNGGTFREVTLNDIGRGGRSKFNDDLPGNHRVIDGGGLVSNGTGVEAESVIAVRKLDAQGNPTGPEIEIYVYSQGGNETDIWGFGLSAPLEKGADYIKVGGDNDGTVFYRDIIACFAAGTMIAVPQGETPVEDIGAGDLVWTLANGFRPVRWVGTTHANGRARFAPVRIAAGALGNDRDLLVSQQHRMWIETPAAELHFGHASVLVAAKHLCGLPGVDLHPMDDVRYTHLMFDRHEILRSNGLLSESFFLAEQSVSALEDGPRAELLALFPDITAEVARFGTTVVPTLTAREAATLKLYLAA